MGTDREQQRQRLNVMSGAHAGYYASLNGFLRVVLGNVFLGREL